VPLYTYEGGLLTEGGALAASEDCCCYKCCEFLPCDEEAEPVYYRCDTVPEEIEIGDVIKIGDECYEYNGEVDCVGDEAEGSFGGDIFEDCDECQCICVELVNCDDPEDIVYYKRCPPLETLKDVVLIGSTCYEILGEVDCEGAESLLDSSLNYFNCETCDTRCNCPGVGGATLGDRLTVSFSGLTGACTGFSSTYNLDRVDSSTCRWRACSSCTIAGTTVYYFVQYQSSTQTLSIGWYTNSDCTAGVVFTSSFVVKTTITCPGATTFKFNGGPAGVCVGVGSEAVVTF
jgi:hypothetical protein